jgi:4-hydroxybenzoate polyprenyltransferase
MPGSAPQEEVLDPGVGVGRSAPPLPVHHPPLVRQLPYAVRAMRPLQWSKNGLVLLAVIFARQLTNPPMVARAAVAFAAFCLAASTVYLLNDIADRDRDRLHAKKRRRPLASGRLSLGLAAATAAATAAGAAALAALLVARLLPGGPDPFAAWGGSRALFAATLGGYVALNLAYSAWLKHVVLWDVFVIAAGFVLRALAGAFAAPVPISPWFYLCAMFLALFLALGKRRAELLQLDPEAESHRRNLREYSVLLLDQLVAIVVTSALICYSLYTFQSETGGHALMITIPIVIFGVFRYLYLIYVKAEGDEPDVLLWRDRQVLASVALCVLVVLGVLYLLPAVQHQLLHA